MTIYINQLGACELGRGDTFEAAMAAARAAFPKLTAEEVVGAHIASTDGDVVWSDEPVEGYND